MSQRFQHAPLLKTEVEGCAVILLHTLEHTFCLMAVVDVDGGDIFGCDIPRCNLIIVTHEV